MALNDDATKTHDLHAQCYRASPTKKWNTGNMQRNQDVKQKKKKNLKTKQEKETILSRFHKHDV